jgi:hypothetical protein
MDSLFYLLIADTPYNCSLKLLTRKFRKISLAREILLLIPKPYFNPQLNISVHVSLFGNHSKEKKKVKKEEIKRNPKE